MHRSLQPFSMHELRNRIMIIIENLIMVLLTFKNVLGFLCRSEGGRAQLNYTQGQNYTIINISLPHTACSTQVCTHSSTCVLNLFIYSNNNITDNSYPPKGKVRSEHKKYAP